MSVGSCGDIHILPEDCIANALSLTSPKDVGRLSVVASTFRSASQSDAVWERFLPSDYRDILSRAVDGSDSLLGIFHSKKELYLHLCDHPVLIDGGRKTFSLDKLSGKKCYTIGARELQIVWADTPRYWQWISLPESRFSEVAELLDVCWFDIKGKMNVNMLSSDTKYAAYLVFATNSGTYGFDRLPAEGSVTVGGNEGEKRSICLDPEGAQDSVTVGRNEGEKRSVCSDPEGAQSRTRRFPSLRRRTGLFNLPLAPARRQEAFGQNTVRPRQRDDGWMEVELGQYFVGGSENGDMEVSLMEVKGGNWKHGLVVEGIEIRPTRE